MACFIDGFDDPLDDPPGVGPCIGARTLSMNGRSAVMVGSKNLLIENNSMVGPFMNSGIILARGTINATVVGNEISGLFGQGIRVSDNAAESTTIRNNKIDGNRFPLNIAPIPILTVDVRKLAQGARFFGSQVSLNDFLGGQQIAIARIAIGTCSNNRFLGCLSNANCATGGTCVIDARSDKVELSELDRGNYWGRDCADSDGFRVFNEPDADGKTDSSSSMITDSHPYGESVAGVPESLLPASCK